MTATHLSIESAHLLLALVAGVESGARAEVPVGAVVSDEWGRILASAGNRTRTDHDPLAHAEVVALRAAAARRGDYLLTATRLTVTLIPCPLCRAAAELARVAAITFGAPRPLATPRITPEGTGHATADSETCFSMPITQCPGYADDIGALLRFFFDGLR